MCHFYKRQYNYRQINPRKNRNSFFAQIYMEFISRLGTDILSEICFWLDDARNFIITAKYVYTNSKRYRAHCTRAQNVILRPQANIIEMWTVIRTLQRSYEIHALNLIWRYFDVPAQSIPQANFLTLYALIRTKNTPLVMFLDDDRSSVRKQRVATTIVLTCGPASCIPKFAIACYITRVSPANLLFYMERGRLHPTKRFRQEGTTEVLDEFIFGDVHNFLSKHFHHKCILCQKTRNHIKNGLGTTCYSHFCRMFTKIRWDYCCSNRSFTIDEAEFQKFVWWDFLSPIC